MKIRNGFVSNSSSSSFIVISDGECTPLDLTGQIWNNKHLGESKFGWQRETYHDVYSKVNFAFLQALELSARDGDDNWLEMLDEVIKDFTGVVEVQHGFDVKPSGYIEDGYIDHQSSVSEDENTEMFYSKEDLKQFLFCKESYIQNQNDNS